MSGRRKGEFAHRIETPETWVPPLETEKNEAGLYVPVRGSGANYTPTILSPNAFKAGFAVTGGAERGRRAVGEVGMEPDWDVLQRQPAIQRMATHIGAAYDAALKTKGLRGAGENLYKEGRGLYDERRAELTRLGEQFNETRDKRGMPLYFENNPEVAGLAISHLYSHAGGRISEKALNKTLVTGGIVSGGANLRTNQAMANAIETGAHPMDVIAQQHAHGGEVYDIAGATLDQDKWKGEWGGVQRGIGYPITRQQHDLARGIAYGMTDRGISGNSPTAARRYMAFQGAHLLAQHGPGGVVERTGRKDSPARFQAITSAPWAQMVEKTGGRFH